jgi:Asp-tRNA(Asn)/Glu-tRNA(Gln) amidotransferase A subunit family amidase
MSIIGPASFCGVVGYKPSWGTIPADGLVLMSESIDTIGFLAQDVDSVTLAAAILTDIGQIVPAKDKAVLGVPLSLMRSKLHDYAEDAYRKQLKTLADAGFEVRPVEFMDFDYVQEAFRHTGLVLSYEMARVHKDWFPKYAHLYRKRTAEGIRFGQTVTDEQYRAGQAFAKDFRARIADLMDREGIDLWTLPGSNGAAPEGYQTTGWIDQTGIWGLAGLGSVVVPAGFAPNGLPLGLQFLPRFGDDARLLAWVSDIEPLFADVKTKLMQAA